VISIASVFAPRWASRRRGVEASRRRGVEASRRRGVEAEYAAGKALTAEEILVLALGN
jgi:hypothetical protein